MFQKEYRDPFDELSITAFNDFHVARGGGWDDEELDVRVMSRWLKEADAVLYNGIRLVRTIPR